MQNMTFRNSVFALCFAVFTMARSAHTEGAGPSRNSEAMAKDSADSAVAAESATVAARQNVLNASYFVADLDPNANDENPGTEDKPFRTINGALKKLTLKPGDTVWIKNGTYRESLRLKSEKGKDGKTRVLTADSTVIPDKLSLSAYPGHRPVIKGSDVVAGWRRDRGDIWVLDNQQVNSQLLFADGEILDQIGGTIELGYVTTAWKWKHKGKNLSDMFAGSFYYDLQKKQLYVWLKNSGNPNDCVMEAAVRKSLVSIGTGLEQINISGLTLLHANSHGTEYALSVAGKYCTLRDIDQSWAGFGGMSLGGEYNNVINCSFNHNGNSGMGGRGRGHRILDCETNYNNYRNWSRNWHSGGVKFVSFCHDWVVKGHEAAYNNGFGIWFDARMSNITIEGCRSFRNIDAGIHYEIGSRGVIKNNICYENGGREIFLSNSSYCLV